MKKAKFFVLTFIVILGLFACSKAEIEKYPVTIKDTSDNLKAISLGMNKTNDNTINDMDDSNSGKTRKMSIMLEGIKEEINVQTYKSKLGYQIDYDIDRFTLISEDGIDSFIAVNANPDLAPYVYIGISRIKDIDPDVLLESLSYKLHDENVGLVELTEPLQLSNEISAEHIYVRTGQEWNSGIRHYYIIDVDDDILFIETQYFVEAEEGYGARIEYMLSTLK